MIMMIVIFNNTVNKSIKFVYISILIFEIFLLGKDLLNH